MLVIHKDFQEYPDKVVVTVTTPIPNSTVTQTMLVEVPKVLLAALLKLDLSDVEPSE